MLDRHADGGGTTQQVATPTAHTARKPAISAQDGKHQLGWDTVCMYVPYVLPYVYTSMGYLTDNREDVLETENGERSIIPTRQPSA